MVQAKDFCFNGTALSDISPDIMIVSFDTSAVNNDVSFYTFSVDKSEMSYDMPVSDFYTKKPEDNLKFSITFAKNGGGMLTRREVQEITAWLLAPKTPKEAFFMPYINDTVKDYAVYENVVYIGVFTAGYYQEMGQVGKMGITFDFENISPYGFTDETTESLTSGSGTRTKTIEIESLTGELVYPTVTITPNSTGTVVINNTSDSSRGELSVEVNSGQVINVMNGVAYLIDGTPYSFDNFNTLNFIALRDGDNVISVAGDCAVDFTYREYINIGV